MAWRAALLAALPLLPSCSAIAFARWATDAAADAEPQPDADEAGEGAPGDRAVAAEAECQEAKVGTPCYESVGWLRRYGLSKHPEWYPGYTSESSFDEVQGMLHGLGKANCPKPCFARKLPADACRDVAEGGCYESILWLKRYGLARHPDWYPGLGLSSSVAEIQAELHRTGKGNCPQPCASTERRDSDIATTTTVMEQTAEEPTGQCMDAKPNTPCYSAVIYGLNEGISKFPNLYEGFPANGSISFKKVQEYMYLQARPSQAPCKMPCPSEQVDLETLANHPEELRVKKRVEDMSMNELSDFFSGKWDGYVSKMVHGDWQPSTTFEKRLFDPTTTVPESQLPDYEVPLPLADDDNKDMGTAPAEAPSGAQEAAAAGASAEAAAEAGAPQAAGEAPAAPLPEVAPEAAAEATAAPSEAEAAAAAEPEEAANGTMPEEAANGNMPEEAAAEVAAAPAEEATASPDVAAVPTEAADPAEKAEAAPNATEPGEVVQDSDIVDEPMPEVGGEDAETREEMEQRIRKELLDEMQRQTTTVAVHQETEEEMRQRLKAELMRELTMSKSQ